MASPLHDKPLLVGCVMLAAVAIAVAEAVFSSRWTAFWVVLAAAGTLLAAVNLRQAAAKRSR